MPKKKKELGYEVFITVDGETHPWNSLSEEKQIEYSKRMMENTGRGMSDYYARKRAEEAGYPVV